MMLDRNRMSCFCTVYENFLVSAFVYCTIKRFKGHLVDALVLRGDEGRNTLR